MNLELQETINDLIEALQAYLAEDECILTPDYDTRIEAHKPAKHENCKYCKAFAALNRFGLTPERKTAA